MENDQLLHENCYFILDSKTMTWKLKYAGSQLAASTMFSVICTAVILYCFSHKTDQTGDCFSSTDKTWVRVRKQVLPSWEVSLQKGRQAARGRQWFSSRWWNWTPRQLCSVAHETKQRLCWQTDLTFFRFCSLLGEIKLVTLKDLHSDMLATDTKSSWVLR